MLGGAVSAEEPPPMCGIFGIVDRSELGMGMRAVERAVDLLQERGPDDRGLWEDDGVVLGHTRLSVMDPSAAGHQPMVSEDGRVAVTFNGEIYRFWELRAELEERGHGFRSRTDTEVILRGYQEWGRDLVDRIDGMFALGIWDGRSRELLLVRDRFGKKPLFWTRSGGTLAFASMLRPLVACGIATPEIALEKLREFLFFNYVIGPDSILRGVRSLPPGSQLSFRDGRVEIRRYWDLADAMPEPVENPDEEEFEALVNDAVRARLVSDVPLGIFLSGGVDSSLVTALAQRESDTPLRTFTIGFDEPSYDERASARVVAERLGTTHEELVFRAEDVAELLPEITCSADHLLADQSLLPLTKLAIAAKRRVKVVLTGDGGDELAAGYPTYRALPAARAYTRLVPEDARHWLGELSTHLPTSWKKMGATSVLSRFLLATRGGVDRAHASWRAVWQHEELDALLRGRGAGVAEWRSYGSGRSASEGWTPLQRALYADVSTWLVDSILAKVDRATMATGLEARSPLLDSRLFAFTFHRLLPDSRNHGKAPLRRLAVGLLGSDVARRRKAGFQTPFGGWFAGPLRALVRESLDVLCELMPGLWNEALLRELEEEHASRTRNHDLKLLSLLSLAAWAKLFPGVRVAPEADLT
jgi:asparagine synthase (glutamine-hydrolysing)